MNIPFSRRSVLQTAVAAAASRVALNSRLSAAAARKMTINLSWGAIGVKADQVQAIEYAHRFGFESVDPDPRYLASLSQSELAKLLADMKAKKLAFGPAGLTVEFRKDDPTFEAVLKELPALAQALEKAGVTRVGTWLSPTHDTLTYLQNFKQHARRLREIAIVLASSGLRLGLEYVGPKTSWTARRYPFIHTMAEARELIAEIGKPNVGFVLDSWHWYTAGETQAELRSLKNEDIVAVDLNDAPAGIPADQQMDLSRELPMATGVIDVATFLNTLNQLGYDGPVRAEPFNAALRKMPPEEALAATIAAMQKAFALIR